MNEIKSIFHQKGLRLTPQRELIYRLLAGSKAHPTADQVYREVLKTFPAVSFNTVYKTVRAFEEAGLLQRFNTGENIYRYDANTAPHPHFICLSCGRVDDMGDLPESVESFLRKAAGSSPNQVKFFNLHFYGHCKQCGDREINNNFKEEDIHGGSDQ